MPGQTKTRDIGYSMNTNRKSRITSVPIQLNHPGDCCIQYFIWALAFTIG